MKFSINDFFGKCDQMGSFSRIWSHLLKKSLMENFIFCAVTDLPRHSYTEQKLKFSIKDFFGKCDQILSFQFPVFAR